MLTATGAISSDSMAGPLPLPLNSDFSITTGSVTSITTRIRSWALSPARKPLTMPTAVPLSAGGSWSFMFGRSTMTRFGFGSANTSYFTRFSSAMTKRVFREDSTSAGGTVGATAATVVGVVGGLGAFMDSAPT